MGLVSGRKQDKSKLFEIFYGDNRNAPLVREAAFSLECELVKAVELPDNTLFVGEITGAWGTEGCLLEDGSPDYRKAGAFLLTVPDNSYLGFGEYLGKAWSIGAGYKQ